VSGANHQQTVSTEGEIQFSATTELDNGLMVRARIEYEAVPSATGTVDERYFRFSGGFGSFIICQDDSALSAMSYQAPTASWQMGLNSPTFAVAITGGNAVSSFSPVYINAGGDGGKLIYFTPRMSGFQLGVSYQPDGGNEPGLGLTSDATAGGQETLLSVGANFTSSFDNADVAISAAFISGNLEAENAAPAAATGKDLEAFTAGVNVSMSGFTVGGAVRLDNQGGSNSSSESWEIGATYGTGPWTVGVNYLDFNQATAATIGDDTLQAWALTAQYNLGPGVNLWGGVKHYDFEDGANAVGSENSSLIGALGTSIWF